MNSASLQLVKPAPDCSSEENSWYSIIQDYIEYTIIPKLYSDYVQQYKQQCSSLMSDYEQFADHAPPQFNEALYYRILFNQYYPKADTIIPYYLIPKWSGDVQEPSARVLDVYKI